MYNYIPFLINLYIKIAEIKIKSLHFYQLMLGYLYIYVGLAG